MRYLGKKRVILYDLSTESGKFYVNGLVLHNTDSLFISGDKDKVLEFLEKVNKELPGKIQLDLEDFYVRGIFVKKRGEQKGAKKKYALLSEQGYIKLRGFEAVRTDWAPIVKEVQTKLLEILLKEGNIEKARQYIKEIIRKLRNREIPWEKLLITETIRKPLEKYKVEAPHVAAAKKYKRLGYKVMPGFRVRYLVVGSTGRVSDRIKIDKEVRGNEYDPEYYIEKQLLPAVEQILESVGIKDTFTGKKLTDFFK